MNPPGISCAAVAIMLSATSCIEQPSADRRPHPKAVPERPAVESAAPGESLAWRRAPGGRTEELRPFTYRRGPRVDGAPPADGAPRADEVSREARALPAGRAGGPDTSSAGDDVWERVRLLMTMVPVRPEVSSLREFRRKLRRYHGNQRFFDTIANNARPWLYHVTRQLAKRGLPGELALVPAVESAYDPRAVSSRNAAGLWQILPGTARDLKLSRSWWYDARHDAPAATAAALDYLTSLRDLFDNDWLLAVAAYNCGPSNVRKAIRRAGLRIETADYPAIEPYLPKETRSHVARWLVLSEMVAMPRLHNVRMREIPWRPYFTEVAARPQVNLENAARRAGLPPAELAFLNLGFLRGMTAPNGPQRLLVPAEHAERLGRELSRTHPVQFAERRRYRVREGDTLGRIARAHGTTVKALMAANRLDSHLIRTGRDLMVPVPGDTTPGSVTAERGVHVVSHGESLWLIARLYRTTVRSLRDWNRLAPGSDLLRPGQQLRVRGEG